MHVEFTQRPRKVDYAHEQTVEDVAQLGRMIRRRRCELGYTQEQVAAMMGVSPRLVGELERGRPTVAFGTVLAAATGLGIDILAKVRGW